jgi:hypothetical protein
MKKKYIFVAAVIVAVASVSSWNISKSKSEIDLSDTVLANVEALAGEDTIGDALSCYLYGCQPDIFYNCHVYIFGGFLRTCPWHKG